MNYSRMNKKIEQKKIPDVLAGINGMKIETLKDWENARASLVRLVADECYGRMPDSPADVAGNIIYEDKDAIGGKAVYQRVILQIMGLFASEETYAMGQRGIVAFEFPVNVVIPKEVDRPPVFLSISFSPALVHEGMPLEEIIDQGYAVVSFYYQDVAPDKEDEWSLVRKERNIGDIKWGAISKWAWAAGRVMDYIEQRKDLDAGRVGVAGGSRLGKTALWAAVCDERFSVALPMISGTAGISLYRENGKENIDHLIDTFPYWFCGSYAKYRGKEGELPFDANLLAALVAPRYLYVCCADRDLYDDTKAGYLTCIAAGRVYELYGKKGLCAVDRYPEPGEVYQDGEIGYHLRKGTHYISRYDWQQAIAFRNKHGI